MIRSPREDGSYRDRDLDCQEALEAVFLAHIYETGTPFSDFARVRAAVMPEALAAGWQSGETEEALQELVRCYAARPKPVRI